MNLPRPSALTFPFTLPLLALLTLTSAWAQTLYVPGGTVGTSANGNVGIGTTNPEAGTHLFQKASGWPATSGTTQAYGILRVEPEDSNGVLDFGMNAGSGAWLQATHRTDLSQKYPLLLNPNGGNIGIGTTSPGALLHVMGVSSRVLVEATNVGGNSGLFAKTTAGVGTLRMDQGGNWAFFNGASLASESEKMRIDFTGNVGIGTANPTQKLSVNGTIRAKEVIVDTGWSDYVFADDYRLAPLSEVEAHIRDKKHLPGIPSAAEVAQGGVSLGDMQARLLAKVEELTLHMIRQEREIQSLKEQLKASLCDNSPL